MAKQQFNTRLPSVTHGQIDTICEKYGLTKTQVIILAVDRLLRDLLLGQVRVEESQLAIIEDMKS